MNEIRKSKVDLVTTKLQDFHGRRITNASPSQAPNDYVIKQELDDSFSAMLKLIPETKDPVHFSVQTVVTGSRALGTVYQNTNKTLLLVVISVTFNTGNVTVKSDNNATPTTIICQMGPTGVGVQAITFLVLPGNYYSATKTGTATLLNWTEWIF